VTTGNSLFMIVLFGTVLPMCFIGEASQQIKERTSRMNDIKLLDSLKNLKVIKVDESQIKSHISGKIHVDNMPGPQYISRRQNPFYYGIWYRHQIARQHRPATWSTQLSIYEKKPLSAPPPKPSGSSSPEISAHRFRKTNSCFARTTPRYGRKYSRVFRQTMTIPQKITQF
jgi:hypothetical protein